MPGRLTDGDFDPTALPRLVASGYATSRRRCVPADNVACERGVAG